MKHGESQIFDSDSASASDEPVKHVLDKREPAGERPSRPKAVSHFTPAERAARGKAARAELPRSAHAAWEPAPQRRDPIDLLEEQARRVCQSSARSGTGACWCPRSPSSAAARISWRPILRMGRARDCTRSSAATRISRISASSPHRTGGSSSASTISTRRCRDRSSGTSSGSPPASRSRAGTVASTSAIRRAVVRAAVREYRETMARFAQIRNIEVWYARLDVAAIRDQLGAEFSGKEMKRFQSDVAKRANEGQHASAHQALSYGRRRAPGSSAIPLLSPRSRTCCRVQSRSSSRTSCGA